MKQTKDYNCGHFCLKWLGFKVPKIKDELSGNDIRKVVGKNLKGLGEYLPSFKAPGLYLMCKTKSDGHWIASNGKVVYDPRTGRLYSFKKINKKYRKYEIEFCVKVKKRAIAPT